MLRRSELDAIVFDLGGVVLEIDFHRAFSAWGAAAGVPAWRLAEHFAFDEPYCAHERGELDEAGYFAALGRTLGIALSREQWLAGWNAIFLAPLPGIERLLGRLSGRVPLYVFSNTNHAHLSHFAPRFEGLLAHFHGIVTSCELGRRKPEPEAFLAFAERVGARPSRLVFFDDLEENVAGARLAGLRAHRVSSPEEVAHVLETNFGL